jgi:hypothetical protein
MLPPLESMRRLGNPILEYGGQNVSYDVRKPEAPENQQDSDTKKQRSRGI